MKSFLKQAVVKGAAALAKATLDRMWIIMPNKELIDALALAVEHGQQEIRDLIAARVDAREKRAPSCASNVK
ncbi:hypothetical protein Gpo141_00008199 [Globisporangium polare]